MNVFKTVSSVGGVFAKARGVLAYASTVSKWANIANAIAKHCKALDAEISDILSAEKDDKDI